MTADLYRFCFSFGSSSRGLGTAANCKATDGSLSPSHFTFSFCLLQRVWHQQPQIQNRWPLSSTTPIQPSKSRIKNTPFSKGDHLRLIQLSPGNFNASIHVKITNYSLDFSVDKPPYCAVSYTWNDSEYDRLIVAGKRVPESDPLRTNYSVRHPLWVEGKRILISTNLRDALRRFRDPKQPVTLWIDALCS
jgi:hypothetical protein